MNMPMLFAAGFDWLEALLPLLFVLFWIISQVVNVIRAVGKAAQPKPQPPVRPAVDPEMVEARRDLERQLEEFLRRSGDREGLSPPPAAARSQKRRQQPQRQQPPRGELRRQETQRPSRPRDAASVPPIVPDVPTADHALGSLGGHATEVARHVEEAFASDLQHRARGDMGAATTAAIGGTPTGVGADLVAMLRTPASLRRLILLREVLDRPVERW